jgi:two-component system, LytTR family, response regulator
MHCLPPHFPILRNLDLSLDDLVYLEGTGNYTTLHFAKGQSIMYSKTLKLFERALPPEQYVRISKTYIIRRDYIRTQPHPREIILQNGLRLKVARRRSV